MKKKALMIGAGLTIGSALMVSSAFADIGGATGYDAYKSAIKTTASATSATQHIVLTVRDNGKELLQVNTTVKESEASGSISGTGTIEAGTESQSFDFYNQDGRHIFKSGASGVYYVLPNAGEEKQWKHHRDGEPMDPALSKEMEKVIDALVGNLKNHVVLSGSAAGGQTVDFKLTGSQIPTAANMIGSLLVKEALNGDHHADERKEHGDHHFNPDMLGLNAEQIAASFPKLTDGVNIDEVALHAAIDGSNYIGSQEIDITISGKDASGQAHEIVISADIDMSAINATTPDRVDLTGKNVTVIEDEQDN